jgi:DNA-binding transcriptional MerR regulator
MEQAGWTLDELVAQVATVLDNGAADQPSRRVRQVPDRRAIRWYTTIGLLDRPVLRGRTGWYGQRHLWQLVAIKRLQAAGKPLAEIQTELAGATDATLRRVARLPDGAAPASDPSGRANRTRFWAASPAASAAAVPAAARDVSPTAPATGADERLTVRYALELTDGVTLLLPAAPQPQDLSAVREAARPLIDQLTRRGLTRTPSEGES